MNHPAFRTTTLLVAICFCASPAPLSAKKPPKADPPSDTPSEALPATDLNIQAFA